VRSERTSLELYLPAGAGCSDHVYFVVGPLAKSDLKCEELFSLLTEQAFSARESLVKGRRHMQSDVR